MKTPTALRWSRSYFDGMRLYTDGDHVAAERALREAAALAARMRPRDARLACSLYALARLRQVHGRLGEAQRLYSHALAVERQALGADHPYTRDIAHACATVARQIAWRGALKSRRRPAAAGRTAVSRAARLAAVA
jgi:hypothetical protein